MLCYRFILRQKMLEKVFPLAFFPIKIFFKEFPERNEFYFYFLLCWYDGFYKEKKRTTTKINIMPFMPFFHLNTNGIKRKNSFVNSSVKMKHEYCGILSIFFLFPLYHIVCCVEVIIEILQTFLCDFIKEDSSEIKIRKLYNILYPT